MGGGGGVTNSITKIQLWNQTLRSRTCQISFPFIVVHQPSDDQAIYSNKLTQGGGGRGGGVTNSITKIQLWNQTLRSHTCQISFPFIVVHQPSDDQAIYSNKLTQGGGGGGLIRTPHRFSKWLHKKDQALAC